jgi:acetyl-CoA carboxylase biotin carboxyl carrier protein
MATEIKAHITGTIWKIPVNVGDEVEADDTLVIIESMKMEMPIEADDDCTIIEIKAQEGEAVQEGDVILIVEES